MVTATWRVDAYKEKPEAKRPSRRSNDGPFTMSVVWVGLRIVRAAEYSVVTHKSPSTAGWRGGPDKVIPREGVCVIAMKPQVQFIASREDRGWQYRSTAPVKHL